MFEIVKIILNRQNVVEVNYLYNKLILYKLVQTICFSISNSTNKLTKKNLPGGFIQILKKYKD